MAVECKYPAFAKTSWPPSLCCNRLWKDGAKCLGIMLVLCDKAGCFYYKPTTVKRLKKNSNISCLHLFSTQRINSCRSGPGENTSIYSHSASSHHFLLFYRPWTTGVSVSACFLGVGGGKRSHQECKNLLLRHWSNLLPKATCREHTRHPSR